MGQNGRFVSYLFPTTTLNQQNTEREKPPPKTRLLTSQDLDVLARDKVDGDTFATETT